MNLEHIPRKTEKGRVEVQTRAFRVGPRERSVLIMIDGKTPAKVLLAQLSFMNKADKILDELRSGGFIDAASPIDVPPVDVGTMTGSLSDSMESVRRVARDSVLKTLGPRGHELAVKLEHCDSHAVLTSLLGSCRDVIATAVGGQKAQEFWMEIELALQYG
jgi:hypothetical protein